jgi:DNA-binding beta-propeller fold protein YncE
VVAPTGLGLGHGGGLYVADTGMSSVWRIPAALTRTSAGTGTLVSSGGALNGPLGLAMAPNGNVLTVNGGDGRVIEITPAGHQIFHRFLDRSGSPPGSGALFGLAVAPHGSGLYFVDDAVSTLRLLH